MHYKILTFQFSGNLTMAHKNGRKLYAVLAKEPGVESEWRGVEWMNDVHNGFGGL